MKKTLSILFLLIISIFAIGQNNTRNGKDYPSSGELHFLIVFADVTDDTNRSEITNWNEGELPSFADELIDDTSNHSLVSYFSRYFNEASFGTLNIYGDYYPNLLQFTSNQVSDHPVDTILDYLINHVGNELMTHNNYGMDYFDQWAFHESRLGNSFRSFNNEPDSMIDMLVIVWRRNSRYRPKRDGGSGNSANLILDSLSNDIRGCNGYITICNDLVGPVMRHEFGHSLIGHNSFHSGGAGEGKGSFLSNIGGYSILSSYNNNLGCYNGWDRWRLGWKNADNQYYISARDSMNTENNELNADLVYKQFPNVNEYVFVLRDFATTGDAIRIELPYLQTKTLVTKKQYLWIENHQMLDSTIEAINPGPQGIRLNIEVGNDNLNAQDEESGTNYIVPLSYFGNHDFVFTMSNVPLNKPLADCDRADTYSNMSNPFTGYHAAMLPAIDYSGNDSIGSSETAVVKKIFLNRQIVMDHYPVFGNDYDAFPVGSSLGIATNPPATPLLTYRTNNRNSSVLGKPYKNPSPYDNRYIWLNGLRVDIVEQDAEGNIKVRIRWDDFDVNGHVRWCGPIMLTEQVDLQSSSSITLDYGLSPTKPINPRLLNGKKVFADPTVFTCRTNSLFTQEPYSTVNVENLSSLVLESGSTYEISSSAALNIKPSGLFHVKSGATLIVNGTGYVEIQNGAFVCIEDGAQIVLTDPLSAINLRQGYQVGTNPALPPTSSCCTSTPLTSFSLSQNSNGAIHEFGVNDYIQNETFTTDEYRAGNNIYCGYEVTSQKAYGDVVIEDGANVILDADEDVILEHGVEVELGGTLEIR